MGHLTDSVYESRLKLQATSIKIISFLNRGLQMVLLAIFMSSIAACSGVPLVPGI